MTRNISFYFFLATVALPFWFYSLFSSNHSLNLTPQVVCGSTCTPSIFSLSKVFPFSSPTVLHCGRDDQGMKIFALWTGSSKHQREGRCWPGEPGAQAVSMEGRERGRGLLQDDGIRRDSEVASREPCVQRWSLSKKWWPSISAIFWGVSCWWALSSVSRLGKLSRDGVLGGLRDGEALLKSMGIREREWEWEYFHTKDLLSKEGSC